MRCLINSFIFSFSLWFRSIWNKCGLFLVWPPKGTWVIFMLLVIRWTTVQMDEHGSPIKRTAPRVEQRYDTSHNRTTFTDVMIYSCLTLIRTDYFCLIRTDYFLRSGKVELYSEYSKTPQRKPTFLEVWQNRLILIVWGTYWKFWLNRVFLFLWRLKDTVAYYKKLL